MVDIHTPSHSNHPFQVPKPFPKPISVTDHGGASSAMKYEANRLKTFETNWPCPFMSPKDMAAAGFYFIQFGDIVRCAFCGIEIGQWEEGDDAMSDHQRWQNNCPFVRGRNVGNVPIDAQENGSSLGGGGEDTCGKYGIEVRPNSFPEREAGSGSAVTSQHQQQQQNPLWKLGITPNKGPTYPKYATEVTRIRSFKDWPKSIKQKPEELSAAGFFYTGKGDQTLCFSCGGGLKDWEDSDDPWEQHAKWFSKCVYLQLVKGHDFIKEVCSKNQALITPKEAQELNVNNASASKEQILPSNSNSENSTAATINSDKGSEGGNAKEHNLCKICFQEEMGVVFLPCGHLVACIKCAPSLKTCAVCRKPLEATVRVFLS